MINKDMGLQLIDYIDQENMRDPLIEVGFAEFAKGKANVDLRIVASPEDPKVMNFLAEIYSSKFTNDLINNKVTVALDYTILHCSSCKEQGYTMRKDNCLSGGRYCMKSLRDGEDEIGGEVLLIQALKNNCTEKILREKNEGPNHLMVMHYYWVFNMSCMKSFSPQCSNAILSRLRVKDQVFKCIKDSFIPMTKEGPASNEPKISLDDNSILKEMETNFKSIENYNSFPLVKINGWLYRGDIDYNQIMNFVCSHIKPDLEGCYTLVDRYSEGGSAFKWIAFLILLSLVIGAIVYCRIQLKKKFRNELSYQIDQSVSSFLQRTGTDL